MCSKLWTREFTNFKEALESAAHLTLQDVIDSIPALSDRTIELLQLGPLPARFDCRICQTFGYRWMKEPSNWDLNNPAFVVFIYHEVPKASMNTSKQLHYGTLANDIYNRGIETYRAAGWTGNAEEANA